MMKFERRSIEQIGQDKEVDMRENSCDPTQLIDHHRLEVSQLFTEESDYHRFAMRFDNFLQEVPDAANIMRLEDGQLTYLSESFIPPVIDPDKPSLLLLLGNPAPESIELEAMFAYEGQKKRYHRFWRVLSETELLQFPVHPDELSPQEKMARLYQGEYESPFNVLIMPFYSFPTPPGGQWNGVAGIRRLFGPAFAGIESTDLQRVAEVYNSYIKNDDAIIAFQKDAFIQLAQTQPSPPNYNYRELLAQPLVTPFQTNEGDQAHLICALPTRLLHSRQTKSLLTTLARHGTLKV